MVAVFRENSMKFLESWLLYYFWLVQKNDKVLSHDGCRLQRKEYEIFGKLVALSFLVGAKGPQCFCRTLVSYMLGVTSAPHCTDDVPDKIL